MTTSTKDEVVTNYPVGAMDKFIKNIPTHPQVGDLIEGRVLGQDRMALYIDLSPMGTGIIYGREYLNARDIIKKIAAGDIITAKVVEAETEEGGYVGLSLKEARQAIIWAEAENAIKNKTVLDILVKDANKGGLILEWQNIVGFLPASQLKAEHYPRINDGDKDKIMNELRKLIGTKISVTVITANPKEGKLIFSEKVGGQKERVEMVNKYSIGDVLDGEVTGAVDFGVFVKLEDGLEGLVHISEIDWSLVDNPKKLFKAGDKIKVKVIDIKDGKVSLSIKALKESPWKAAESKYKKSSKVNGVVIKYNKHGALVSIEEGVAGLAHISLFGTEEGMKKKLDLGKSYDFVITLFDAKEQKMTLVPADLYKEIAEVKVEEKKEEVAK
ncbi:MAG: S1 RNA-binding domain-containing protein [Patescibacteria group bacterium]